MSRKYSKLPSGSSHVVTRQALKKAKQPLVTAKDFIEQPEPDPEYTGLRKRLVERNKARREA